MPRTRIVALVAAAALLLAGCATEYQKSGATGGFKETQLGPDLFRVSFTGNSYTSQEKVQDYALLRAAELTLESGARYFAVVSSKDQSKSNTYVSDGYVYSRGDKTYYTSPTVNTYYHPGVGMVVRTFKEKPKAVTAFDAQFLVKSIRTKYEIK